MKDRRILIRAPYIQIFVIKSATAPVGTGGESKSSPGIFLDTSNTNVSTIVITVVLFRGRSISVSHCRSRSQYKSGE